MRQASGWPTGLGVGLFVRRGMPATYAETLADRLAERDHERDDTTTGGPEAGKGKPSGKVATDPPAPPPKTEAEIVAEANAQEAHGGVDVLAEIKAAEARDLKAEALKWRRIAADGEGAGQVLGADR